MKNILLSFFLIVLLLSSCNGCRNGESNGASDGLDSLGQNVSLGDNDFENIEYKIPSELQYARVSNEFLMDKFYPIGWSKDGKFAYITEPADEGSGYYWFEIVILDIVNHKEIWSWKPKESEQGSIQTTWNENYELFKKNLSEAEIVQQNTFELKPIKTSYKGNDYEIVMDAERITDPDFGFEVISEVDIKIDSEQLGQKSVAKIKEGDYSRVIGVIIPGFLLSPFDDRIVIICKKDRIGYEGPPNVVYFELMGSDLTRGFKGKSKS